MQPLLAVRPMLMLTGFLGAGKTTLLKELLVCLTEHKVLADVILNDRENAIIDQEVLRDRAAEVSAVTASCVCCEGYDELIDMVLKASKSQHDLLMIELNGTADPVPLQESFTLLESKFCMRPRWQVCVLDARHFGQRGYFNELESLQLETASHYFISWGSELTDVDRDELDQRIKSINPRATRTSAALLADALSQAVHRDTRHKLVTTAHSSPSSQNFTATSPLKQDHEHRHKIAHEFTGCNIVFPEPIDSSRITHWLSKLPDSVMRVKALIEVTEDRSCRYLYERVGQVVSPRPETVKSIATVPCSGIFIGADLDPDEILELTRDHLHPNCHFSE